MDTGRGSRSDWGHSAELNLHNASSPSLFLDPNLDRIHLTRYPCRSIAIRRTATLFIVYLYMLECWKLDSGWDFWGLCCTLPMGRCGCQSMMDDARTDGRTGSVETLKAPSLHNALLFIPMRTAPRSCPSGPLAPLPSLYISLLIASKEIDGEVRDVFDCLTRPTPYWHPIDKKNLKNFPTS